MKKVALISLGCAKNLVDSEVMLGHLEVAGYKLITDINNADIIIINTCGFIQPARNEALGMIRQAVKIKNRKKATKLIVTGCYVENNQQDLLNKFPSIDEWLGVKDFDKIVHVIEKNRFNPSSHCFLYDHNHPRRLSTPASWAYLKISEGCSHKCSFCAIPTIKGSYRSRSLESIITEADQFISKGIKEINLVSQDSTFYGRDIGITNGLTLLLTKLLDIRGLSWLRVLYGYPEEITDSLLDIMQSEKICSYLDLPFQHSHPKIVKIMKRGLDGEKSLNLLKKIRENIPGVSLRTSLVVGFPGESNKEFSHLKYFVEEARFDHLGVFAYSREKGTSGYSLGDPVKTSVKQKRKDIIMEIQAEISRESNLKYIGKSLDTLIEGRLAADSTVMQGRSQFQAPEVDGVIFIDSPDKTQGVINTIQKVEIQDRDDYDLYGRFI